MQLHGCQPPLETNEEEMHDLKMDARGHYTTSRMKSSERKTKILDKENVVFV